MHSRARHERIGETEEVRKAPMQVPGSHVADVYMVNLSLEAIGNRTPICLKVVYCETGSGEEVRRNVGSHFRELRELLS